MVLVPLNLCKKNTIKNKIKIEILIYKYKYKRKKNLYIQILQIS